MIRNYGRCVVKTFSEIKITVAPTPSDANVVITATGFTQDGNSIVVYPGTSVTYTVSKTGYFTATSTVTAYDNQTINVALEEAPYLPEQVVFESSTPGSYTLNLLAAGTYRIICVGAGGGAAAVSTYKLNSNPSDPWHNAQAVAGGGSGGYSQSTVSLSAGAHYIQVGSGGAGSSGYNDTGSAVSLTGSTGGGSTFDSTILAYPGGGGYAYAKSTSSSHDRSATGGGGGPGTTTNGNAGSADSHGSNSAYSGTITASGGASVYGGYGTGGSASATGMNNHPTANNGGNGYVKVTFVSY